MAYLELAREAGQRSIHQPITQLKDISWQSPISVNEKAEKIHISLYEEGQDIGYEVYSLPAGKAGGDGEQQQTHSQGKLSTEVQEAPAAVNLKEVRRQIIPKQNQRRKLQPVQRTGSGLRPKFSRE